MISSLEILSNDALQLLQSLIAIPSLSKNEDGTANCIAAFLDKKNIQFIRQGNNVWAINKNLDPH